MANVIISQLPLASALTGAELVPIQQNGNTVQTTTSAIAVQPTQTQPFLTVGQQTSLANSRQISVSTGLTFTDGGAQGSYTIAVTGALSSLVNSGNGIQVKTNSTTLTNVSIASSGVGVSIANADGTAGNPTISLSSILQNLVGTSTSGFLSLTSGSFSTSSSTGTGSVVLAVSPALTGTPTAPTATTGTNTTQIATTAFVTTAISSGINVVNSFNGGTTGLTPSTTTSGVITLGGVLNVTNGGTGVTTSTGSGSNVLSASPALTGTPTAPTASNGTASTQIATTQFVQNAVSSSGGGTVTVVSVVSANGFAGTVANPTSTPAVTLTTTITGVLKGNGTALLAATAGTDYAPPTSGTSILYGNNAGGFSNVTIGSGLSFSTGTLTATGSGGTVTSVSFTGGIISISNPTTTPALTVAGTSGGIPYFSSTSAWASSALLTLNALMIGGGAGSAPSTTTTGTGVLTALGNATNAASGVVVKDANSNVSANNFLFGFTSTASAGTTTTLTVSSTQYQLITGSTSQTFQLPNATTLVNGTSFVFNNNSSAGTVSINNGAVSPTLIASVGSGGYVTVVLIDNSTQAGSWDYHYSAPSNTTWGTNTFTTGSAIVSTQTVQGTRLISTVATGTAPLTVTSTTQVANLNAATAGTATNATNVALSAGTGATNYIPFSATATGNQPLTTNASFTYNYTNNALTAGINGGTF
jgi:hypothetical protein